MVIFHIYILGGGFAQSSSLLPSPSSSERRKRKMKSPMTKAHTPIEKSKKQRHSTKKSSKTSITQRLQTDLGRSVVVTTVAPLDEPVNERHTFQLTATVVLSKGHTFKKKNIRLPVILQSLLNQKMIVYALHKNLFIPWGLFFSFHHCICCFLIQIYERINHIFMCSIEQ